LYEYGQGRCGIPLQWDCLAGTKMKHRLVCESTETSVVNNGGAASVDVHVNSLQRKPKKKPRQQTAHIVLYRRLGPDSVELEEDGHSDAAN
jgi:hypothetical protein